MNLPVYLDNNSTTRVDPAVLEEMLPYFTEIYGNASSKSHEFGWKAASAVTIAREKVAALIGAEPNEITFTSGATESINLALKGISRSHISRGNHIITTKIEHNAVLDTCKTLERHGFEVTYLDVDKYGLLNPVQFIGAIKSNTILVSVIFANNEIGTINDVEAIGKLCREKNVLFHVDAAQAVGKFQIDARKLNIDLMSFTAHKLYGPKGTGALFVRKRNPKIRIEEQIDGGGHERGLRSGTLNVPGIVGFGNACEISGKVMDSERKRLKFLRNRLYEGIVSNLEDVYLNGHPEKRLDGNLNLTFRHVDSGSFISKIKEIAVSTGSACSSETVEPSHVLKAIGVEGRHLKSSIRFGLGRFNTEEEIDFTIIKVVAAVKTLRRLSPYYLHSKRVL